MLRKGIAGILRARAPTVPARRVRNMAVVILQLMKAASSLGDEGGLSGRAAGLRELESPTTEYLNRRL